MGLPWGQFETRLWAGWDRVTRWDPSERCKLSGTRVPAQPSSAPEHPQRLSGGLGSPRAPTAAEGSTAPGLRPRARSNVAAIVQFGTENTSRFNTPVYSPRAKLCEVKKMYPCSM